MSWFLSTLYLYQIISTPLCRITWTQIHLITFKELRSEDGNIATGPDKIHPLVIKKGEMNLHKLLINRHKYVSCHNSYWLTEKRVNSFIVEWIWSYLNELNVFANTNGYLQECFFPISVVPHSSDLDPLLFIICRNNVNVFLSDIHN